MCKAARTPVIYHDRPSPRLEFCGWTPFPTLSISDAERRAYHNRRVSDARYPQRIFDTLWILVRSDLHHRPPNLTAHQQSSHPLPLHSYLLPLTSPTLRNYYVNMFGKSIF